MDPESKIKALEAENAELKRRLEIANNEISKGESWSQNIIDSIPNPLFIKNDKAQFVSANKALCRLVNLTVDELLGKTDFDFFSAEQAEIFYKIDSEVLANGKINWNEEELTIAGEKHDLLTSKVRIEDGQGKRYVLGIITDITDNKNQQVLLMKQKDELEREKENVQTLLKEVHHRVKNNLQVVSSLLNIQFERFKDRNVQDAFLDCKGRIVAMANVHEILYKTENFSSINFSDYISSLINNLKRSFRLEDIVEFKLKLVDVFLNVDTAIPLGLAINEIITNSIKHAEPRAESMSIYVNLNLDGDNCELEVGDDGMGIDESKIDSQSLGLELIDLFCKQIEAKLERNDQAEGVHYKIKFAV